MNELLSLLQTIHNHSQQLLGCLEDEKAALDQQDFSQLTQLCQNKQTLLDQLQSLDQQRQHYGQPQSFNRYIASCGDSRLIKQWNTTRGLIARCQQQNETNGRLMIRQQQIQQELIGMLSGKRFEKDTTYNSSGNQQRSSQLLGDIKA